VVVVGVTLRDVPLPTGVPPQLPVNQSTVWPLPTEADNVVEPPQVVVGDAAGLVGVLGRALTVTDIWAQAVLTQPVVVSRARA